MKALTLTLALTAALAPTFASAKELVYRIDYAQSKIDQDTAENVCDIPTEIRMDSKADLATVVLNKAYANTIRAPKIQTIQATKGGIVGGDLKEPYMGDYRTRVALVHEHYNYPSDVVSRVEVITYGSPAAPKAFTVDAEILNYRESAEVMEGSICTGLAYKLQQ